MDYYELTVGGTLSCGYHLYVNEKRDRGMLLYVVEIDKEFVLSSYIFVSFVILVMKYGWEGMRVYILEICGVSIFFHRPIQAHFISYLSTRKCYVNRQSYNIHPLIIFIQMYWS